MSDMAKHAGVSDAAARIYQPEIFRPLPPMPPSPIGPSIVRHIDLDAGRTVFDGDDYEMFEPSFDIEGAAARVLAEYDRNGDGAIDLDSGGGPLGLPGETSRFTKSSFNSIKELATYADEAGNRDGSATAEEIADVIRKFDQGTEGDGRLSGQERETFLEVFGEDVSKFGTAVVSQVPPLLPRHPKEPFELLLGDHPPFDGGRTSP